MSDWTKTKKAIDGDDLLINPLDFKPIKLRIEMKNTTTRTDVVKEQEIQLIEIMERGMHLDMPPKSCNKGHNLILTFYATHPDLKVTKFETTAKIIELEPLEEGRLEIQVSLLQYEESEWMKFCSIYSSRQSEIEEFFAAVKG